MSEDFVPFELLCKLKEKGFRYNKENRLDRLFMTEGINHPTISQVLKWLREEKKIHISIITYDYTWGYTIYELVTFFPEEFSSYYSTYEDAVIAGIEYVIDNLI